jgi:hypothetical protein
VTVDELMAVPRKAKEATQPPETSTVHRRQWLTIEDFCAELDIPMSTAYKWSSLGSESGKFPRCCRLPNGKIRIRRDWLEEWLDGLPRL